MSFVNVVREEWVHPKARSKRTTPETSPTEYWEWYVRREGRGKAHLHRTTKDPTRCGFVCPAKYNKNTHRKVRLFDEALRCLSCARIVLAFKLSPEKTCP